MFPNHNQVFFHGTLPRPISKLIMFIASGMQGKNSSKSGTDPNRGPLVGYLAWVPPNPYEHQVGSGTLARGRGNSLS